jgi:hypothetical protein
VLIYPIFSSDGKLLEVFLLISQSWIQNERHSLNFILKDSENKMLLAISNDRFKHGLISKIEYLQKQNEFLDVHRRTILTERNSISYC